jgi:hypothetical protein
MTQGRSVRNAMAPALLIAVIALLWIEGWEQQPQVDDAYISYRYARNLVEGHGLVYNVGERVEGFSNLLWTLLIAAGLALGARVTDVAHALGLASGTLSLIAAFMYASAGVGGSRRWIAAAAPALLLCWIGFPVWTFSGLETPLFTAAAALALAAEAQGRIGMATAAAMMAALTRPEGPLLAVVILGLNVLAGPPQRRRRVVLLALAYAGGLAMLTAFRLYYYGSAVPNTFYAKVGENVWLHGMGDFGRFLLGSTLPLLVPALWAVRHDRACRVGALWSVAMAVYIVSVGGDAFPHHRFWVPVYLVLAVCATRALILQRETKRDWLRELPLWTFAVAAALWSLVSARLALLVLGGLMAAAVAGVWGRRTRWATALGGSVVAALVVVGLSAPWADDAEFAQLTAVVARLRGAPAPPEGEPASRVKTMASLLLGGGSGLSRNESLRATLRARRDHLRRAAASAMRVMERRRQGESIDLVAATAIGKFGWDLPLPILDMLGLADAHIARSPPRQPSKPVMWLAGHVRTDADYVFGRRPDYIFLQRAWSTPLRLPVHDDFWSHPALERDYEWDAEMLAYRRRR